MNPATRWHRFISRARIGDGCWEWIGHGSQGGYGRFGHESAHRAAYKFKYGPIPEGMDVRHKCDNRRCVRYDHLEIGTRRDNMMDRQKRNPTRAPYAGAPKVCKPLDQRKVRWLSHDEVRAIRAATGKMTDMAVRFGVHYQTIYRIRKRLSHQYVTEVPMDQSKEDYR